MSPLGTALWITLIGMGLVFIAILLLWALMEILMRFTARFAADEVEEGEEGDAIVVSEPASPPVLATGLETKQRAAAAAVAVAMAMRRPTVQPVVLTGHNGGAWQAITRSSQLNHATHIPRRSRGSVR